jgi:hypothetical protein
MPVDQRHVNQEKSTSVAPAVVAADGEIKSGVYTSFGLRQTPALAAS